MPRSLSKQALLKLKKELKKKGIESFFKVYFMQVLSADDKLFFSP